MDDSAGVHGDGKRSFPGMLNLMNKPVPATLTENQGDLFVNLLLEILRIRLLNLLHQLLQLLIHPFSGFHKPFIEIGKDPDLNDITQISPGKATATPHTGSTFRLFQRFPIPPFLRSHFTLCLLPSYAESDCL